MICFSKWLYNKVKGNMLLQVPFNCCVSMHRFEMNYSGVIVLSPFRAEPKTFYFLVLHPYTKDAEFSIYEDRERTKVFAEGLGQVSGQVNPHTHKPIVMFDFRLKSDDLKIGLVCVLTHIISEAIYQTELKRLPSAIFSSYWKQTFASNAEQIATNFLRSFGLTPNY